MEVIKDEQFVVVVVVYIYTSLIFTKKSDHTFSGKK